MKVLGKRTIRNPTFRLKYAHGPLPVDSLENEIYPSTLCANPNCDRFACTASERDWAEYCCRQCGEGAGHKPLCDTNNSDVQARNVPGEGLFDDYDAANRRAAALNTQRKHDQLNPKAVQ